MAYDVLYIDHGNPDAKTNYNKLISKAPHTVTDKTQIKTNPYWQVSSHADVTDFDFDWQPDTHLETYDQYGKNRYGMVDNSIAMMHEPSSDMHVNNVLKINRAKSQQIF